MWDIRFQIAKLIGQNLQTLLHLLPFSGGAAAPGLATLKTDPQFIAKQQAQPISAMNYKEFSDIEAAKSWALEELRKAQ